jgi:DNA invertase Pin-like site-specific DNA recombinase
MSDGCAAMYVRVSTGGQSVETQNDAIVRAATARGDRIGRVYAEIEGGAARRRPELDRLLEDVRQGLVRRLYVYRLDRLSRAGIRATLAIIEELSQCGVELVSIADGFSVGGPTQDVVIAVVAWAAQMERAAISERIAAARQRIEAEGGAWGRPRREVDGQAVARLMGQGKSVREISQTLRVPRSIIGRAVKDIRKKTAEWAESLCAVPKTPMISHAPKGQKKAKKRG